MSRNKIVIAGGTGFLGSFLASKFREKGEEVIIISRKKGDILWSDQEGMIQAFNNADLVINLAGKSVNCRYNEANKREILQSRTETTRLIGAAILKCHHPPRLWINSSTATIYRHAADRPMTEEHGEIGKGFSVGVALEWEKTFFDFHLSDTRQIALRMAIVLGKQGGVMDPLKRLVRLGLGGKQGSGQQMFSWIHLEDVFGIISFLKEHRELQGVFNCSSPHPVSNEILMKLLRKILHVKIGLPSPGWLLEIGALFIRTETELILKSRWVIPSRLLESGYTFTYPSLPAALEEIINNHQVKRPDKEWSV
ncbi:MAG: TIGR01777 family oxidoreductase [Flavisolibacter sp.]